MERVHYEQHELPVGILLTPYLIEDLCCLAERSSTSSKSLQLLVARDLVCSQEKDIGSDYRALSPP